MDDKDIKGNATRIATSFVGLDPARTTSLRSALSHPPAGPDAAQGRPKVVLPRYISPPNPALVWREPSPMPAQRQAQMLAYAPSQPKRGRMLHHMMVACLGAVALVAVGGLGMRGLQAVSAAIGAMPTPIPPSFACQNGDPGASCIPIVDSAGHWSMEALSAYGTLLRASPFERSYPYLSHGTIGFQKVDTVFINRRNVAVLNPPAGAMVPAVLPDGHLALLPAQGRALDIEHAHRLGIVANVADPDSMVANAQHEVQTVHDDSHDGHDGPAR